MVTGIYLEEKYLKRFAALREKTNHAIKMALSVDSHCKSYEGSWELNLCFPDYFQDEDGKAPPDFVEIMLHCYVLGPSRHYRWLGHSFEEALVKAEAEVNSWIAYEGRE